ncbi:MAG: hypothetical protein K2F79_05925, partial [Muribaculaceae bacterium]|nr:hypothetical protein [Muribaculaceae bacterium]
PRQGEHILMNAYAPARACGVGAVTPVLVFVRPDGRVSDISIGVNQDLSSIVIQKVGLAAGN